MPLEVSATLDRPVAIYLTGEVIVVSVSVKNVDARGKQSLAWGSVQLCCERTIGAQPALPDRPTTAIAKSASTVYTSVPTIIFCDVQINSGEQRQFKAEIPLPRHGLPPSFRGHLVKYMNKVTIAVQHVRAPIKLVHIPIRLIPTACIEAPHKFQTNPFLIDSVNLPTVSETVASTVDEITAPRKAHVFCMTNADGLVTSLTLFKKAFRVGEDIIGYLNFENAPVPCIQYFACLETVEELIDGESNDEAEKINTRKHYTPISQQYGVCIFNEDTIFRLPIPLHAPPTFHTDLVHLKWRLKFEFVTSKQFMQVEQFKSTKAPIDVPIETLTWHVDIYVFPCTPENGALTDVSYNGSASMLI